MSIWKDNERLAHILDDSDSDTEEQHTDSIEHVDPIDSANPVKHTDISFMMDEAVTTTPEERTEEKEHYYYMMDAYEDPFLYSFEAEQPMDVKDISFCLEDPEITTVEERIELEIEVIPTVKLTKQVEFGIFEVASYQKEKERDCYILDVITDPTFVIEPQNDVFYMIDMKAYHRARSFKIHGKLRKMMSRLWPRTRKARRSKLEMIHEFYGFYHIPYNDPRLKRR